MKRIYVLLLTGLALTLTACAGPAADTAEPAEIEEQITFESPEPVSSASPEPTPEPTPVWQSGIAAGYGIGVLYGKADRGTEVDITGEEGACYIIHFDDTDLYVEKNLVRDIDAAGPAERTAYAWYGAEIYSGPYLTGEPLEKPVLNTVLTVLDEFGDLMLVRTAGSEGYISAALVSPVWIALPENSDSEAGGQNSSDSAYSGGADGGDIPLGIRETAETPVLLSARYEPQSVDTFPERGVILADGTELYLGIVYPGDELMVLSEDKNTAEIYTSRGTGTLPRWAVLLGDEEPYGSWTGYASYYAKLYESWRLAGMYEDIYLNSAMTVILETDGGFFVQLADGRYGYMKTEAVSRTVTEVYEDEEADIPEPAASEWTEPVL